MHSFIYIFGLQKSTVVALFIYLFIYLFISCVRSSLYICIPGSSRLLLLLILECQLMKSDVQTKYLWTFFMIPQWFLEVPLLFTLQHQFIHPKIAVDISRTDTLSQYTPSDHTLFNP